MTGVDLGTANALVEVILKAGAGGALLWVLIGGHYKLWVYGRELTQLRADTEQRIAEVQAETERVRTDLTHQIYWWQDREGKQRETIDRALIVGEKLTEALRRAGERTPGGERTSGGA